MTIAVFAIIKTIITIIEIVMVLTSIAMTIVQLTASAKKGKGASQSAQDSKKGFEVVVEGQPDYIGKVYGRAKVGGTRVYHNVCSDFKYVSPEADQVYQTATHATAGGTFSKIKYNVAGDLYNEVTNYSTQDDGSLSKDIKGHNKNEFLFFQQILCQGPINNIIDVIIDESRYLDDPNIGDYVRRTETSSSDGTTSVEWKKAHAAMRINTFNSGGKVDKLIAANFSDRANASFDNMAYITAVVRLDREAPQFSSVPSLQFLIEGSLVRTVSSVIVGGVSTPTLSSLVEYSANPTGWIYSNNPAWCLLDYLLDKRIGKGLSPSDIDLGSFQLAAAVCAKPVQTNAVVAGKFYKPTDGSRNIDTVTVPLYECNIIIDPKRTIRENIEAILETMADARLIWSNGKYKLNLQYVTQNSDLLIAATLTDDDLVLTQNVTIAWPSASQRLNFCTVRYHTEFDNFKEDSVSWPPKYTTSYMKGVGGKRYTPTAGSFANSAGRGRLLNDYGVWSGGSPTTLNYKLLVPKEKAGTYTLSCGVQKSMVLTITDSSNQALSMGYTPESALDMSLFNNNVNLNSLGSTTPVTVTNANIPEGSGLRKYTVVLGTALTDQIYSISITATGGTGIRSVAAKLENTTNILWTTRDVAYDAYVLQSTNSGVYDTMLGEDNGVKLEFEMFSEGISDPYHAMAKAEELVRTSRSAFSISFKYLVTKMYLEPGDYVKIQSESLYIGSTTNPLIIRINSIKMIEGNECEVTASRFDYTQLAWSVKDDVYTLPPNVYTTLLAPPEWLLYVHTAENLANSSGTLTWPLAPLADEYVLYTHTAEDPIDADTGLPIFREIGRASKDSTTFNLPQMSTLSAYFGIKSFYNGSYSDMTYTSTDAPVLLADTSYEITGLVFTYNSPGANQVSWSSFTVTLNGVTVKTVATGYATWSLLDLYIYYDPIANVVKSTTNINIAYQGKLLLIYKGGSDGIVETSDLLPPINFYVKGTIGNIFATKDLDLTWDYNPANNLKKSTIAYYLLAVINPDTNVVMTTARIELDTLKGGAYTFTYADNTASFGTAKRSFIVKLYSVSTTGALSDSTSLNVNNPAIAAINWSISAVFKSVVVTLTPTTQSDLAEYIVFRGLTANFAVNGTVDLLASNIVYRGTQTYINIDAETSKTYYYVVAAIDTFGTVGAILSSSVAASAIPIDPDTYVYTGLSFIANHNGPQSVTNGVDSGYLLNSVYWTAATASKNGETATTINSGTAVWTTGTLYIYYIPGNSTLQTNTSLVAAINANGRVLATYKGGADVTSDAGKSFISGDQILTGSIGANALVTNTAIITNVAQFGNILQSDGYANTTGSYAGWRIDKTGWAQFNNITIKDSSGNTLMSSSGGVVLNAADQAALEAAQAAADAAQLTATNAQTAANTAQTAANNAATNATTANTELASLVTDNKLSPIEKQVLIRDVDAITGEYTGIYNKGVSVNSTLVTAYTTAYNALNTYLATLTSAVLWNNISGYTTVVRATFKTKFSDYYTARQNLLNDITAIAQAAAATAQSSANTASTAAGNAQTTANNAAAAAGVAQTNANNANTTLSDITTDTKLSIPEKQIVIRLVADIVNEKTDITAKGTALSATLITAYNTAYTALITTYLAGNLTVGSGTTASGVTKSWNDVSGATTIVRLTFKTNFNNYYTARQNLLNEISAIAATKASWSEVSGTGKPQDYATYGAYLGDTVTGDGGNTTGKINGNIQIANASIQTLQVAGDAITAMESVFPFHYFLPVTIDTTPINSSVSVDGQIGPIVVIATLPIAVVSLSTKRIINFSCVATIFDQAGAINFYVSDGIQSSNIFKFTVNNSLAIYNADRDGTRRTSSITSMSFTTALTIPESTARTLYIYAYLETGRYDGTTNWKFTYPPKLSSISLTSVTGKR
jgi:hypothetical protein